MKYKQRAPSKTVECPFCGKVVFERGLFSHTSHKHNQKLQYEITTVAKEVTTLNLVRPSKDTEDITTVTQQPQITTVIDSETPVKKAWHYSDQLAAMMPEIDKKWKELLKDCYRDSQTGELIIVFPTDPNKIKLPDGTWEYKCGCEPGCDPTVLIHVGDGYYVFCCQIKHNEYNRNFDVVPHEKYKKHPLPIEDKHVHLYKKAFMSMV